MTNGPLRIGPRRELLVDGGKTYRYREFLWLKEKACDNQSSVI
jgi:hypothetical protein